VKTETAKRHYPKEMWQAPRLPASLATPAPAPRRALLINPFYKKDPHGSFGKHVLTPSLALTSLAAATPPAWTVDIFDENLLGGPPPIEPFPSVVGITVHLTFAKRAYHLAAWYRERGALVVLGGPHVSACPGEAAGHADAIAMGEGVQLWPRILGDANRGHLQPVYRGGYDEPHFADAPVPRRDALSRGDWLTTASLIATRGCNNRCSFCWLSTRGTHIPRQARDPRAVAAEAAGTGEPYVVFVDNNLGADRRYLRALCRELAAKDLIWSAAVTIDVTDEPDLIREMSASGCTGVFLGLESLGAENLTDSGKKSPHPDDYARRVAMLHDAGIQVNGSFVFGFDHDRPDVFARTLDWVEGNGLESATFHVLTPYPGTPLFRKLEREGRLLHEDRELYDTAHAVFQPKHMSPQELEEGYAWAYTRLMSWASTWARRPQPREGAGWAASAPELAGYLAMSLLYKHANPVWPFVIRHRLTHALWQPMVRAARSRKLHVKSRAPYGVPRRADGGERTRAAGATGTNRAL
jgi:radical SAM superfamily enzyme YgiQ (UPF0313 family)